MASSLVSTGAEIDFAGRIPILKFKLNLWNLGEHRITAAFDRDLILLTLFCYGLYVLVSDKGRSRFLARIASTKAVLLSWRRRLAALTRGPTYELDKLLSPAEFSKIELAVPRWKYTYEPLRERFSEIRLLYLLRGSGSDVIRINILRASLDDRPKYIALSYVWGTDPANVVISLNGCEHRIQPNLAAALSLLRQYPLGDEKEIPVWVDALCINQDDVPERNAQIKLMRSIYISAFRVKVWLGVPTEQMELAAAKMRIFEAWIITVSTGSKTSKQRDSHTQPEGAARFGTDLFGKPGKLSAQSILEFDAICQLLDNPWFSRAWVIQEVSFPDYFKVEFVIGRHGQTIRLLSAIIQMKYVLPGALAEHNNVWAGLSEVAGKVFQSISSVDRLFTIKALILKQSALKSTWDASYELLFGSTGMRRRRVLESLQEVRRYNASDARDKVYIPLGLALVEYSSILRPDYGCSLEVVYAQLVASMIEYQGNLDILSCCDVGGKADSASLPTWVPDWQRCSVRTTPLAMKIGKDNKQIYRASGNKSPIYKISDDYQKLTIKGILVCEISKVMACGTSTTAAQASMLRQYLDHQLPSMMRNSPNIVEDTMAKTSRAIAIRHTMVADHAERFSHTNDRFWGTLLYLLMGGIYSSSERASSLYQFTLIEVAWDRWMNYSGRGAKLSEEELISLLMTEKNHTENLKLQAKSMNIILLEEET